MARAVLANLRHVPEPDHKEVCEYIGMEYELGAPALIMYNARSQIVAGLYPKAISFQTGIFLRSEHQV